uniref:Uncharacterized protein n=1 Tax=Caenorhabditis japonica TaxID=281687 RepID=A0A8R1E9G5_CAEJA
MNDAIRNGNRSIIRTQQKRRALLRPDASPGNSFSPITLRLTMFDTSSVHPRLNLTLRLHKFTIDIHAHAPPAVSRLHADHALSSGRLLDHFNRHDYSQSTNQ